MKQKDYSKSKVYKLVCNITGLVYIGHTTEHYLSQRLNWHRTHYRIWLKNNKSTSCCSSFDILKNNNYNIILIENYPCKTIEEIQARERFYIESNKCVNKNIPTRTQKEYRETNKDKIKAKQKEHYINNRNIYVEQFKKYREKNKEKLSILRKKYREQNKEYVKQKQKEWYKNNKDKVKEYEKQHKEHIKERTKKYREKVKDKLKQNWQEYWTKNKEKILKQRHEKIECECGCKVSKQCMPEHLKTKKHQNFLTNKHDMVDCECGSYLKMSCLSKHLQTKKHQNYIESKQK